MVVLTRGWLISEGGNGETAFKKLVTVTNNVNDMPFMLKRLSFVDWTIDLGVLLEHIWCPHLRVEFLRISEFSIPSIEVEFEKLAAIPATQPDYCFFSIFWTTSWDSQWILVISEHWRVMVSNRKCCKLKPEVQSRCLPCGSWTPPFAQSTWANFDAVEAASRIDASP